ncbi:hypothetical protein A2U01_0097200, partial [Trifolium medium]|nr:hypothetical protein [Trifolium medium]
VSGAKTLKVNPVNSALRQARNSPSWAQQPAALGKTGLAFCARLGPPKLGAVGSKARGSRKC